jgi:hypothetical protein
MTTKKQNSLEDLMLLIELETLQLKTDHTKHVEKGNISAGRRARVSAMKITHYLKEYRSLSVKNIQVPE